MAGSLAEEKTFRRFLELFLREMRPPLQENDPLPMRPLSDLVSDDEVEGECLDLCLQHLYKYNCPCSLAAALARATADSLLQSDLSIPYLSKTLEDGGADPLRQLEAERFARLAFNRLFETCLLWLKEFPYRRRPLPYYETSIHAIKNMRRKMEDKHVVIPDFNSLFNIQDQEEQAFFAVYDGHGGVDAAIYAANHLHVNLVHQESFRSDPSEALCRAFKLTDERFIKKASRENLRCGSTGVVTFLRGRMLHVAWLGDSQVMLVRRGEAVELMKPHKPDREDEKQRIEALGGCVIWFGTWRVNGSLSVSRSIGDNEHKPYISGDADHATFPLDGSEDYLILACDGFWDTVTPDEAVRVVTDHLTENAGDTAMVAHKLVASARDAGSSDNISVIVVFLRDPRCPHPPPPMLVVGSEADMAEEEEAGTGVGVGAGEAAEPDEEEAPEAPGATEADTEEENEEEEEEEEGGMRGGGGGEKGSSTGAGGKQWGSRGKQCSAPADLGYEDRMDSFTDRTSLSLLGVGEGRVSLTAPVHVPSPAPSSRGDDSLAPSGGWGSSSGSSGAWGSSSGGWGSGRVFRPTRRPRAKPCVPACLEEQSATGLPSDPLWALAVPGLEEQQQQGRRHWRMASCCATAGGPRWSPRRRRLTGRDGRLPGSSHPSVPCSRRRASAAAETRPGVAAARSLHLDTCL